MLTSASNLTPQVGRFFAKDKGAKKRPTRSAVYAGVRFNSRCSDRITVTEKIFKFIYIKEARK